MNLNKNRAIIKLGDLADKNNITYSTRYKEANTGLVSYTYRHYSPRLKKWLSKDPIAEHGGLNLYQMVDNMPIDKIDILGQSKASAGLLIMSNIADLLAKDKVLQKFLSDIYKTSKEMSQMLKDECK